MIYESVLDTIGRTPLVEISRFSKAHGLTARLLAKLESRNPGGSAKDRVAVRMLDDAEQTGRLLPGGTIIEATSGNTGLGLALAAAVRGYHVILTMPETMSVERRKLLAAFGAKLELTPGAEGMAGATRRAEELLREIPGSILASQFENPANPDAHVRSTGPEIWADTDGKLDAFVSAVGTGGTVTGCGRYLKSKSPRVQVFAVEPAESPLLSTGHAGAHGIQGIGANFVPKVLDRSVLDGVLTVPTASAMETARELTRTEGILAGISSGAALSAAVDLAKKPEWAGKTIVVLLPDTGERYLSTKLFSE